MTGNSEHSFRSNWQYLLLALLVGTLLVWYSTPMRAQTLISGEVAGTITDPSGAVVPNAKVTLKSNETGQSQTATTNSNGYYRFPLQKPGNYTVTASAPNFQAASRTINVAVGQATTTNVKLALSGATQTVTVTGEAPVVQTENGNISTTFTQQQIELMPNPGNDLSYIAQTAPGSKMNTQAGYGNFETFGLPATSNLFTVNGEYEIDPFLNLNNSGATNLLLGQNDVREATVVNNGYTGQYGGMAGANVNYVTKSGSNAWHGNASYWWNGRMMNANDYLNKQAGNPRPFDNVNQWAGSLGGPIVHNNLFFFVDTEGLRVLLPRVRPVVRIPTPQFEQATLQNLGSTNPAEVPFYQNLFKLYNSAPGAANATPLAGGGCADLTSFAGPCAQSFGSVVKNLTHEWLLTGRLDWNISSKDLAFIHFRSDHGLQATYTDPISSVFNADSIQPQYEGQFNYNHTFSPNTVNQLVISGSWYSAIFKPSNLTQTLQTMPLEVSFAGNAFFPLGNDLNIFPQGRNVTQYQGVDDISHTMGNHTFKFGVNFVRNDVSDYDLGVGTIGNTLFSESMTDFFNGNATAYSQTFVKRLGQPLSLYNLGFYAQDEWKMRPSFTLTATLRADRYSNFSCSTNCFARLAAPFDNLSHNANVPYNQAIISGQKLALPSIDALQLEPRIGFAWSLFGTSHTTVLRGGVGLFTDRFPGFVVDSFLANPPISSTFVSTGPLDPNAPGSAASIAAGANASFQNAFASGGTLGSITASNPLFTPPGVTSSAAKIHYPRYEEWNLELQQGLGQKMSASINYVGNHGIHEPFMNTNMNAYCDASCLTALSATTSSYGGLPTAVPDPRFGWAQQLQSSAISNYNGVTMSLQRKFSALTIQASYTYSHALDEISNGGLLPFNFNTNESVLTSEDPHNLRRYMYGNADYDMRHYGSLSWVYTAPTKYGPGGILGGWVLSGTVFGRSGMPFTPIDSGTTGILSGTNCAGGTLPCNFGGPIAGAGAWVFADQTGATDPFCARGATNPNNPCPNPAAFTSPINGFSSMRRNQFYGPQFFDMDFTIMKNFHLPGTENARLGVGAQFFNILNHPNFDQPINDIAAGTGAGGFGNIVSTVSTPTSVLGSFLGGNASPRLIQLTARIEF